MARQGGLRGARVLDDPGGRGARAATTMVRGMRSRRGRYNDTLSVMSRLPRPVDFYTNADHEHYQDDQGSPGRLPQHPL
jgi:hypothetical protein